MNIERLILAVSVLIASLSLALVAATWAAEQREDRDPCARLADLGRGIGIEAAGNLGHEPDLGVTLVRDCLTE